MTELDMGCSEYQLEDLIKEMEVLNEHLDATFEKINNLISNIKNSNEWINMGKPEMESYLSLLSQYQRALSGMPGVNVSPTKQIVTELKSYAGELESFKIEFKK